MKRITFIKTVLALALALPADKLSAAYRPSHPTPIVIAFDLHEVLMKIDIRAILRTALYALVTSPRSTIQIAYDYLRDHEFDLTQQSARNIFNSQCPISETWNIAYELNLEGFPLFLFSNIETQTFAELKQRYPSEFSLFKGFHTVNSKKQRKPALSAFLSFEEFVKSFGYIRPQIIFIDDNAQNIAVAQKIGWNAILFRNSSQLAHDLEQTLNAILVPSMIDRSLMKRPTMLYQ